MMIHSSLSLATDPAFLILLKIILLFAPLLIRIHILTVEIFQHLVVCVLGPGVHLTWQSSSQSFDLLWSQLPPLWHSYLKLYYQIALLLRLIFKRHTQPLHHLLASITHDVSRIGVNHVFFLIQVH